MKMLRKLSAVLLFAALTLAVLAAANFLLVDDVHSYSRAMLQELYADAGKIDTLFLGSSHCYRSVDPDAVDAALGTYSFNAGSSQQLPDGSYYMLREAAAQNQLKTVYLEMFYTGYNQSASKNVPLACYLLTDHMRWNSPNRYAYQAEMGGMAAFADLLLPVTEPLWHAPKGGEKLAFTVLGANGLSTLFLWWLAIHQTQSYAPDAQTAALAQLGQLAALAARWLPLGMAWLLVLAGTLFCISLVRSALQAVHYTVWRTDTQLGSRGGLVRRYEMRLRLSQLNYADLRRSPATWALHYCPVFVSAGACRPELPLFVWREGTPLLRELLPEMAQLPPDTRADTTDRSMVFFLPAGIPLGLCLLLTAVSRTTLPALTLPLLIPTGVFAALLGAAAVGWHREGVWQQQGQLLLCRQHRFHLHQLCVFHPDTCFTALQSPWAVTVQRANLTLIFPGKEKVTVRSVPLAALDFLEI